MTFPLRPLVIACMFTIGAAQAAPPAVPATVPAPPVAAPLSAAQHLLQLAERYYEAQARFEPIDATYAGDNRFDDLLPMTHLPAVRARRFAMLHGVQQELMKIDRSKLGEPDQVTFDCLSYELTDAIRFEGLKDYLMPLNQMDAVPVMVANFANGGGAQPLTNVAQYQLYLKRISALPQWIDGAIAIMRVGIKTGVVLPKALVLSLLPQIKALADATPEKSEYTLPVRQFPASVNSASRDRLTAAYKEAARVRVLPALRRFAAFLETEYLPAARATDGMSALPDGPAWYQNWVTAHTSTNLRPDEIHRIGMADMERIHQEMGKLAPKLGYLGAPAGLPRWMAQQSKFRPYKTDDEVLQAYRDLYSKVQPLLPALFGTLPKASLEIRAEPPLTREVAYDHYSPAAEDGSHPGVFWAVIPDPAAYASTRMTSLFLHEGVPGHHLQLSRLQEMTLPHFRRNFGNSAYTEGWALYAETLGKEMGLYDDPNAYAGFLMMDLRRAGRLVVDTGLHAKGWTRAQTIRFLVEQAGESEEAAKTATERYMAWPGQALSYKISALKIVELRQRAVMALGDKFNLARFHDALLAEGPLPLGLLETRINAWIAKQAALPAKPKG